MKVKIKLKQMERYILFNFNNWYCMQSFLNDIYETAEIDKIEVIIYKEGANNKED